MIGAVLLGAVVLTFAAAGAQFYPGGVDHMTAMISMPGDGAAKERDAKPGAFLCGNRASGGGSSAKRGAPLVPCASLIVTAIRSAYTELGMPPKTFAAIHNSSQTTNSAAERLGVWAGNLRGHLDLESLLKREIRFTHQKIGKRNWDHAKKTSRWISDEFAAVADRVTLSLIFDLIPSDGSTTFADVMSGSHDADLRSIAANLIDGGHGDAILRLMHEGDIPKKRATFRDGKAADFIATWRHVHDVMMGVPGAEFQWQYSLDGQAGRQQKENDVYLTELGYPGDNYVDSVSIGNYDRGKWAKDWAAVEEKLDFICDFAVSHGKKVDLAEWGLWPTTDGGGGDNRSFIENTVNWFEALPVEQKGYLLYFNAHPSVNLSQYPKSEDLFLELFGLAKAS